MVYHKPALLNETVDGLVVTPDGIYVDATFGGGGHAREILKRLSSQGKLFAFDQDPEAAENVFEDDRLVFIQQNFAFIKNYLKLYRALPVDGVLADFGVSFHQFDQAERGFSFRFSGPLDMRMDKKRALTAAKVLNTYEEEQLKVILSTYGELKNAGKLAAKIVEQRAAKPLKKIDDLKALLVEMVPEKVQHKFLAQVFQAIRIEVNEELKVIEQLLQQAVDVLKVGGRIAVITYHSLEDRLVKNFFRTGNFEGEVKKDFYGNLMRPLEPINRKPLVPSSAEVKENNRARSAKLRIAEKVA